MSFKIGRCHLARSANGARTVQGALGSSVLNQSIQRRIWPFSLAHLCAFDCLLPVLVLALLLLLLLLLALKVLLSSSMTQHSHGPCCTRCLVLPLKLLSSSSMSQGSETNIHRTQMPQNPQNTTKPQKPKATEAAEATEAGWCMMSHVSCSHLLSKATCSQMCL